MANQNPVARHVCRLDGVSVPAVRTSQHAQPVTQVPILSFTVEMRPDFHGVLRFELEPPLYPCSLPNAMTGWVLAPQSHKRPQTVPVPPPISTSTTLQHAT